MANHASAVKAARQSKKHALRNSSAMSQCRTAVKKVRAATVAKYASKDEAKKVLGGLFNEVQSVLMKTVKRGILKPKTAYRQISRLGSAIHRASH